VTHTWHHRYTQDPARDPELIYPKASTRLGYFKEITWYDVLASSGHRLSRPCVRPDPAAALCSRQRAASNRVFGVDAVIDILSRRRFVEHAGCSQDGNGLTNTRTTLTWFPIRLLMWNMPYHAEHHPCPSIPSHQLPALHVKIRGHLKHLASSYVAANRAVVHPLYPSRTN
jgi:fatty acid desaturase